MTHEFIGMIHHRHASEIHPPAAAVFDRGYVRDFAQAAEAARSIACWSAISPMGPTASCSRRPRRRTPSGWASCVAHRPGFVAPTLAARKFATLDQVTGGRAAIHVISGGDDVDQFRDGDTLPKDERYARTDEYVHILKRIWTEPGPVDHAGRYYQFAGASTAMRCVQQPRIPIYFGGASDAAIAVAGKHADVYALWGETHEQVRELTARVRAAAAQHGREVRFSLSFRPILAATEDEAWARAERIKQRIAELRAKAGLGSARAGERRLAPAARRRGAGRAAGQTAVDRRRAADRRARQHHQPGRHAASGGRGAVRLLRPRRHHLPDPRLRSAGRSRSNTAAACCR